MAIIGETVDLGTWDRTRSFFNQILEKTVSTGLTVSEEGMCLIRVAENGQERVQESNAGGGEVWMGVSLMDNSSIATWPLAENATVPAAPGPYTYSVQRTNLVAASMRVYDVTGAVNMTVGAGLNQFTFVAATGVVTFNVGNAGDSVIVYYRYNMTVAERNARFQERNVNNGAGAAFGMVGVGVGPGEIYTSEYDTSQNYDALPVVATGANGQFTITGGAGTDCGRAIKAPTPEDPFLGVSLYPPV